MEIMLYFVMISYRVVFCPMVCVTESASGVVHVDL
jgi:hypothetical protein